MSHTKEPLHLAGGGLIYRLSAPEGGHNVDEINVTMWAGSRSHESRSEGAKRVLDCINACKGFADPDKGIRALESGCTMHHNQAMLNGERALIAEKQRDELLAALIDIRSTNASKHGTQGMMIRRCIEIATDAIASAKGGA